MLNLTNDLIFFDLEATGLNLTRDRIVQIALIKLFADGRPTEELEMKINPTVPVSAEATAIHGLTNADLQDAPTFAEVADRLYTFIGDADLGGYNSNRYDVPLLQEEFYRAGYFLDTSSRRLIDAQHIFYQMEPRTLGAALKFYAGKEMTDAHDALADVRATVEVFRGQLKHYAGATYTREDGTVIEPFTDIDAVAEFCRDDRFLDATRRIKRGPNGVPTFNFGKHAGKPVAEVFAKEPSYLKWILDKDFTTEVKALVQAIDEARRKG
ncbi:DNA polymerase-3 subunit epsilon [Lewinella marina]|uniref:DNA polymerase III subunit epsilon n=1 Tax=Neolewinella marina TaxID=438751 RepID=A0A2G0CH43_9BACT|nr:3'-5' exonuclease [Neolewinella marina]NJB86245.1 DNA polymerase-3 subunit epsilon [Neolewinella marina]PHK99281.1 DNA polymerase III subunit epsilon [Neolewinella marina]